MPPAIRTWMEPANEATGEGTSRSPPWQSIAGLPSAWTRTPQAAFAAVQEDNSATTGKGKFPVAEAGLSRGVAWETRLTTTSQSVIVVVEGSGHTTWGVSRTFASAGYHFVEADRQSAAGVHQYAAFRWPREAGLSMQRAIPRTYSQAENEEFFRRLAVDPNVSAVARSPGFPRLTCYVFAHRAGIFTSEVRKVNPRREELLQLRAAGLTRAQARK